MIATQLDKSKMLKSETCLLVYLLLLHFGSLLEMFDRCPVAADQLFTLYQLFILLLDQSIGGKCLAVQLLQRGLEDVGYNQQLERI